jgi:hypothetical protein
MIEDDNIHAGFLFLFLYSFENIVFELRVSHLNHASSPPPIYLYLFFELVTSFLPRATPASIAGMTNVCKHIQLTWSVF